MSKFTALQGESFPLCGCPHVASRDSCEMLAGILQPDDEPPSHVCPSTARLSCSRWLAEQTPFAEHDCLAATELPSEFRLTMLRSLIEGRTVTCSYSPCPRRDEGTVFELVDEWPYQVTGATVPLWLILRQRVTQEIPTESRRWAITQSAEWGHARNLIRQLSDSVPADLLPVVARSTLQDAGLPDMADAAQVLLAEVKGQDADDLPLTTSAICTTFLLYHPDLPPTSAQMLQRVEFCDTLDDDSLRRKTLTVAQRHVYSLQQAFPTISRISGREFNSGFGSRPAEILKMIEAFKVNPTRRSWDRLRQQVKTWGDDREGDGLALWNSVRVTLSRLGITRSGLNP